MKGLCFVFSLLMISPAFASQDLEGKPSVDSSCLESYVALVNAPRINFDKLDKSKRVNALIDDLKNRKLILDAIEQPERIARDVYKFSDNKPIYVKGRVVASVYNNVLKKAGLEVTVSDSKDSSDESSVVFLLYEINWLDDHGNELALLAVQGRNQSLSPSPDFSKTIMVCETH